MADARENVQEIHETESRSIEETKKKEDEDVIERQRSSGSNSSMERQRVSSAHPIRPGKQDCKHYLKDGWCGYGRNCSFNHPPELERKYTRICRFFNRGYCKYGSTCLFRHDMAGAETESMRQVRNIDQVHGTESGSRPEKRARTIPDSPERGSRERVEDARENPQEQRQENIEREEGEVQENLQAQDVPGNQNLTEEQRRMDIERQRNEARLSLDQMKPNVEFNDLITLRASLGELNVKRKEGDGF